jgi:hypothetical protein
MKYRSILKNIPIERLEEIRTYLKESGTSHRISFRGPRNLPEDTRSPLTRRAGCLKKFATNFSVYPKA